MSEETDKELARLKKAVTELFEHFDSVRIFVTRHDGEKTHDLTWGAGNFHAQVGQIIDFVTEQDEITREVARNNMATAAAEEQTEEEGGKPWQQDS